MSRPRSGVGAELAPLVLILACLAGSLALIIHVHRRATPRSAPKAVIAVAVPPVVAPPPVKPAPIAEVEIPEPEPPSTPLPEDPTPRALASLTSAEAEQLLEASRADRKAQALEAARKSALVESEKWRRRESLVNSQLATLENKARKLETEADELALERDALLRERDARKAAASVSRTQPNQAILPHKGPNGTWRRPIVIECTNGMAILRPQGIGYGIMDLSTGFGPSSNAFVATIAREAVRIQHNQSPDGSPVVPYIFFLVRPDGVRPYYEARGRLEPLGITFGYELADQDWEIDFPDLDDSKTWDGSSPRLAFDPLASTAPHAPTGSPAEDDNFPNFKTPAASRSRGDDTTNPDFTWPGQRALARDEGSGGSRFPGSTGSGSGPEPGQGTGSGSELGQGSGSRSMAGSGIGGEVLEGIPGLGGSPRPPTGSGTRPPSGSNGGMPEPLVLDVEPPSLGGPSGGSAPTGGRTNGGRSASGSSPTSGRTVSNPPTGNASKPDGSGTQGIGDPGSDLNGSRTPDAGRSGQPVIDETAPPGVQGGSTPIIVDDQPPAIHRGPFTRPLAMGVQPPTGSGSDTGVSKPSGSASGPPGRKPGGQTSASSGSPSNGQAAQAASGSGSGTPSTGSPASGSPPSGSAPRSLAMPDVSASAIIDRRYEIVLVCGPRGVIVQPGGYRVTAEALKDRDGLLKKQVVALVKARRAADPKVILEPKVRFLVQPGGESIYWSARSQILLSGLDYPMTTQVADPDPLSILPREGW